MSHHLELPWCQCHWAQAKCRLHSWATAQGALGGTAGWDAGRRGWYPAGAASSQRREVGSTRWPPEGARFASACQTVACAQLNAPFSAPAWWADKTELLSISDRHEWSLNPAQGAFGPPPSNQSRPVRSWSRLRRCDGALSSRPSSLSPRSARRLTVSRTCIATDGRWSSVSQLVLIGV